MGRIKILIGLSIMALILFSGCEPGIKVNQEDYKLNNKDRLIECPNEIDYAMFQFTEDEPMSQHKFIRLEYDEKCNLQNIFEWAEEENSFKTIYFMGYK